MDEYTKAIHEIRDLTADLEHIKEDPSPAWHQVHDHVYYLISLLVSWEDTDQKHAADKEDVLFQQREASDNSTDDQGSIINSLSPEAEAEIAKREYDSQLDREGRYRQQNGEGSLTPIGGEIAVYINEDGVRVGVDAHGREWVGTSESLDRVGEEYQNTYTMEEEDPAEEYHTFSNVEKFEETLDDIPAEEETLDDIPAEEETLDDVPMDLDIFSSFSFFSTETVQGSPKAIFKYIVKADPNKAPLDQLLHGLLLCRLDVEGSAKSFTRKQIADIVKERGYTDVPQTHSGIVTHIRPLIKGIKDKFDVSLKGVKELTKSSYPTNAFYKESFLKTHIISDAPSYEQDDLKAACNAIVEGCRAEKEQLSGFDLLRLRRKKNTLEYEYGDKKASTENIPF